MRRYELMLLLRPDLEDDKLQAAVEKVTRAIVNGGGSLSKVSPWGKRRLAYDIGDVAPEILMSLCALTQSPQLVEGRAKVDVVMVREAGKVLWLERFKG